MAASRSSRVTRSSVGINGLDENFCGRTLRNRSIAGSTKKRQDGDKPPSGHGEAWGGGGSGGSGSVSAGPGSGRKRGISCSEKEESERPENCERLRPAVADGVDVKKPKRCTRSGESGAGGEEEPPTPTSPTADVPSPKSPRPSSPQMDKDKDESRTEDAPVTPPPPSSFCTEESEKEPVEGMAAAKMTDAVLVTLVEEVRAPSLTTPPSSPQPKEAQKATNGLGEIHRQETTTLDSLPGQALTLPSSSSSSSSSSSLTTFPTPAASTPALLNGSQALGPTSSSSSLNSLVPCRSLTPEQTEHASSSSSTNAATTCISTTTTSSSPPSPSPSPVSIPQLPVVLESNGSGKAPCSQPPIHREPELEVVEVDVVGEEGVAEVVSCPAPEEHTFPFPGQEELEPGEVVVIDGQVSGTNGSLLSSTSELPEASDEDDHGFSDPCEGTSNSSDGALHFSGDMTAATMSSTAAGLCPAFPTSEPPSFTEPHEHRYALRTSPRRAPCRPGSPHRDDTLAPPSPVPSPTVTPITTPAPTPMLRLESPSPSSCLRPEAVVGPGAPEASPCRPSGKPPALAGGAKPCPETVAAAASVSVSDGRASSRSTKDAPIEEDEDTEEPDVYYFESDHLALKHNKDYQRLLQTICVLEAQRTQAILDLEALARHQKEALVDPISFVERLQQQVSLGLPCPQRVVQLPEIAWDQYTSGVGDFEKEFCDKKRKTRQLKLMYEKVGLPSRPKSPLDSKKESDSSGLYSSLPSSDGPEQSLSSSRAQVIRGRVCSQNKPDTFNQLWTIEEQKKLEQLLLKFPPEEVEAKRWQKIADELGNRTAKQVASRVQKYFIKLTKAGIPVPGRTPNLCMYSKKASSKRHHHLNKHLYRRSTFMASYEPPVYMDDEDERSSFNSLQDPTADDSDEDSMPLECRHLPEYKELLELKCLKKQKLQEIQMETSTMQHAGYKCDVCGMDPIQGVRWHCQDCPPNSAVDFCGNCFDCVFKTETHKPDHRLEPVYQAETFLDRDYCLPHNTGYSYLDPNYFPANR